MKIVTVIKGHIGSCRFFRLNRGIYNLMLSFYSFLGKVALPDDTFKRKVSNSVAIFRIMQESDSPK